MQIVMELAGYTLGRSDLVRRAMSKKKGDVMQRERQNFVYGNEAENVPGCISRGIDEKTANKIFDEMIDFAKYAFNKSHAAAYAVVAYQTAYLKCHYPEEFMAALITSVLDRTDKVSEYISHCRRLGISILPPDINEGYSQFSVSGNAIRYGLSALKSVGRPVIDAIVEERHIHGRYKDLKDFISRLSNKEVNKRTIESFIKSGALDSFPANRRQMMMIYVQLIDQVNQEKKSAMTGQMSLLDFLGEEEKKDFDVKYPDVSEYDKEELLAYEKEVLGIYVSGHPLEDYQELMDLNISATTHDFIADPDTGETVAKDQILYTIGGMIAGKTVKMTKSNQNMAFITLEDLLGSVEVVVFPKKYEQYRQLLEPDSKIFVYGRASISEDEGKMLLERAVSFDEIPKRVYVQCMNKDDYKAKEQGIYEIIDRHPGNSPVTICLKEEHQSKNLGRQFSLQADEAAIEELKKLLGEGKVLCRAEKWNTGR